VAKKIVSAGGVIAAAGDIMSSDTIKRIINAAAKLGGGKSIASPTIRRVDILEGSWWKC
jgi:hypothetical protein